MQPDDYMLYTVDDGTGVPQETRVAQITAVDPGLGVVRFLDLDSGDEYDAQVPADAAAPWDAQGTLGTDVRIDSHAVYTPGGTDPVPDGVAVVTFGDGTRLFCAVDAVSPTTDVVGYQQPQHRLSFDGDVITSSDWTAYPVGDQVLSIEGYVLDTAAPPAGTFDTDGWWSLAQRQDAFPGRIGPPIEPFAVVVHTTDMVPESFAGLLDRWTTEKGDGNGAHFVIGRDAAAGVVQLVSIFKNGNHAGGKTAATTGRFIAGPQTWHPNTVSVGIELHCAGGVRKLNGDWRHFDTETGPPDGAALPDGDVIPDPLRPGRGWHTVTDYQYEQLDLLLRGLETALQPLPAGCVAQSMSQQPEPWAVFPTGRRVGHASLDFGNRSDPWPPTCDWLRSES